MQSSVVNRAALTKTGVRSAQEGTVQAQQQFSRWEQGQQEREEHLLCQVFVPKRPFRTTLFGVVRTHPWQMGAQGTQVDRLTSDHGLHHVQHAFQRVDPQVWRKGFETAQDFARLETGSFWNRHTLRTLPFLLPDREELTTSDSPHWERLNKDVRY
jgi:hypothetical protein